MNAYAQNKSICRSKHLVSYFGETDATDCGVCNVCLNKKKSGSVLKRQEEMQTHLKLLINRGNFKTVDLKTEVERIS